jgi:hypothetical protein
METKTHVLLMAWSVAILSLYIGFVAFCLDFIGISPFPMFSTFPAFPLFMPVGFVPFFLVWTYGAFKIIGIPTSVRG